MTLWKGRPLSVQKLCVSWGKSRGVDHSINRYLTTYYYRKGDVVYGLSS